MKKILLTCGLLVLGAAGVTVSAANQYQSVPANNSTMDITIEGQEQAIASIEINTVGEINRNAEGYITLSRNGVPLKSIPASNKRLIYCVDGFDKVEKGTPHITFYEKQSLELGNETQLTGHYRVTIPSNFIIVDGEGNQPLVYEYDVLGQYANLQYEPAKGQSVGELTTLKITFPGCTEIKKKTPSVTVVATDPDNADKIVEFPFESIDIEGNVATVKFPPIQKNDTPIIGAVNIELGANSFSFINASGMEGHNLTANIGVVISGMSSASAYEITPAPGTYEFLKASNITITENKDYGYTTYTADYFTLKLPEGFKAMNALRGKIDFYRVDENGNESAMNQYFNIKPNTDKDAFILSNRATEIENVDTWKDSDSDIIFAPGTYYLVLAKDAFTMTNAESTATVRNGELRFGPYIFEKEMDVNYTITPDPTAPVTALDNITITFGENDVLNWNIGGYGQLTCGTIIYDFEPTIDGNKISIPLPNNLTVPGEWNLVLPLAYLSVNGVQYEVKATYIVERDYIKEFSYKSNGELYESKLVDTDSDSDPYLAIEIQTPTAEDDLASFEFILPLGYDEIYYYIPSIGGDPDTNDVNANLPMRVPASEILLAGFVKSEDGVISDLPIGETRMMFTFGNAGECLAPTGLYVNVVRNLISGIEAVEAAEAAEYYTIDGLKVENPTEGLYIKVTRGNAEKVILKK